MPCPISSNPHWWMTRASQSGCCCGTWPPAPMARRSGRPRRERFGPNELRSRHSATWPRAGQTVHSSAGRAVAAAVLAYVAGTVQTAFAILIVIGPNAGFAFLQEQAGRAAETLGRRPATTWAAGLRTTGADAHCWQPRSRRFCGNAAWFDKPPLVIHSSCPTG